MVHVPIPLLSVLGVIARTCRSLVIATFASGRKHNIEYGSYKESYYDSCNQSLRGMVVRLATAVELQLVIPLDERGKSQE